MSANSCCRLSHRGFIIYLKVCWSIVQEEEEEEEEKTFYSWAACCFYPLISPKKCEKCKSLLPLLIIGFYLKITLKDPNMQ